MKQQGISEQGIRRLAQAFQVSNDDDYAYEVVTNVQSIIDAVSKGLKYSERLGYEEDNDLTLAISEISGHEVEPYLYEVLAKLGEFRDKLYPYLDPQGQRSLNVWISEEARLNK